MKFRIFFITAIFFLSAQLVKAQSLAINTDGSTANASALLDVKSNTKGILIPRMSRAERDAIASPATGLLIFQTSPDSVGYHYYDGSNWTWMFGNSNADSLAWKAKGNTGTNPASHFLGTTDNVPLVIKTNNTEQMRIQPNGFTGIGTNNPVSLFANTNSNTGASDGFGVNSPSFSWAMNIGGYVGAFYNANANPSRGLMVKIAGTLPQSRILDLSTGGSQTVAGTPVMVVNGDGKVGIGLTNPSTQLANNAGNTVGNDGFGLNSQSLNWSMNNGGYTAGIYNQGTGSNNNGLAVKVASSVSGTRILDLSAGAAQNTAGTSVLVAKADGKIGIGIPNPDASALLDITSTTRGMLIPRMSKTEKNSIASPATGLLIFQNAPDSIGFYYYNGSNWTWIFSNSNADSLAWKTAGNTGTTDANNFIGTRDNIPFNIRVNNQKAGRIDNTLANSFFGYQAANANTSGQNNTVFGHQAMLANLSGTNNSAFGGLAARDNTTGGQNTAGGYASMILNTVGQNNTTYGFYSLYNNVAGSNATAIGYQSMLYANNSTTPFINNNVAVGFEALKGSATPAANTGLFNSAIGYQTLLNNSSGSGNTGLGYLALQNNTTGNNNTATGVQALTSNTSGVFNTATGVAALSSNTTGYNNTATGQQALNSNIDGIFNTATGLASLFFNTSGGSNTATGMDALKFNTTGSQNTATGMRALNSNTIGYNNTASGQNAMFSNTDGYSNTANGVNALYTNATGTNNTAIGQQALNANVSGSNNTALGYQSGFLATGNNNVFLGYQAGYNETGNNKLYIANNSNNPPIIYGDFSNKTLGFGTTTPNSTYGFAKVEIASEGFGAPADLLIRNAANDAGYAPGLIFQHARGTLAAPVTVNNGDYLSAIGTMNYDGSNYILSAGLDIYADGAIAAGIVPTRLQFNTMNTTGGYAARLTIKNDGKVGIGTASPNSTLHVNGTIAIGTSLNIAGGPSGTPISLLNQKSYVGVLPANGTDNYYQLPDPTIYPGRTYIIRNNSSVDQANITTAAGLLFAGNSSAGGATYTLNPTTSPKTVMAISDGANWTIMVQN